MASSVFSAGLTWPDYAVLFVSLIALVAIRRPSPARIMAQVHVLLRVQRRPHLARLRRPLRLPHRPRRHRRRFHAPPEGHVRLLPRAAAHSLVGRVSLVPGPRAPRG